jgi:glutaredoxin 3
MTDTLAIADNAIAVFSKSYCPYCKAAKETLSAFAKDFYVIELDQECKLFQKHQLLML